MTAPVKSRLPMADTLEKIQDHFISERVFYSRHAKSEMQLEEFGEILDREVAEAVASGRIIEDYPDDSPYPSCLIFGTTDAGRPIHMVWPIVRKRILRLL